MPKWANSATLDTVAYSIDQQRLLREKMKREEQEQKKKEERKKSENKYPGKRKGKNETTTSQEDAKRLKKLEKDERQLDLIRSAIREKGEEKIKEEEESIDSGVDEDYDEEEDDDYNKEEEEEEEEEQDEDEQEEVKVKMAKKKTKMSKTEGKKKKILKTKPQNSRNDLRIDMDLAIQKQNIEKAKSLLNKRVNCKRDLARDIEKLSTNKVHNNDQDVNRLKKYHPTNVKIKKKF